MEVVSEELRRILDERREAYAPRPKRPNESARLTGLDWPGVVTIADVVRLTGLTEHSALCHVERAGVTVGQCGKEWSRRERIIPRAAWVKYCGRFRLGSLPEVLPEPPAGKHPVPRGHVVYFVRGGSRGLVKIGTSSDFATRLEGLTNSNPDPLEVLGTVRGDRRLEKALHEKFAAHRLHSEWFEPAPELLAYIANLTKRAAVTKARAKL